MKNLLRKLERNSHRIVAVLMAIILTVTGISINSKAGVLYNRDKVGMTGTLSYNEIAHQKWGWKDIIGTTCYGKFTIKVGNDDCACFCIDPGTNIKRGAKYYSMSLTGKLAKYYKAAIYYYYDETEVNDVSKGSDARRFITSMFVQRIAFMGKKVKGTPSVADLHSAKFKDLVTNFLISKKYVSSASKASSAYEEAKDFIFENGSKDKYKKIVKIVKWDDKKSGQVMLTGRIYYERYVKLKLTKKVVKPDGSTLANAKLDGFKFQVYLNEKCTKKVKDSTGKDVIITTDKKGHGESAWISRDDIDAEKNAVPIYVKEIKAVQASLSENTLKYTIPVDKDKIQAEYNMGTITNTSYPSSIKIRKVNEKEEPLAGAEFTLYSIENGNENKVSSKVSGSDGWVTFEELYATAKNGGKYRVKETKAPPKTKQITYVASYVHDFVILGTSRKTYQDKAVNRGTKNGEIHLIKTDHSTHEAISGCTFELRKCKRGGTFKQGGVVVGTFKELPNEKGHYVLDGINLGVIHTPNADIPAWDNETNYYYIMETKCPDNYWNMSEYENYSAYFGSGEVVSDIKMDANNTYKIYNVENYRKIGHILITKKDEKTKQPLQGVSFNLYETDKNGSLEVTDNYAPVLVGTGVTDENGQVDFGKVLKDHYYVAVESETVEGYVLDETPIKFLELSKLKEGNSGSEHAGTISDLTPTKEKEQDFTVLRTVYNKRVSAGFRVNKTCISDNQSVPLEGAVFSIYNADEIKANGEDVYNFNTANYKAITSIKTGADGRAETPSDALGVGSYVAVETGVPHNFLKCDNYEFTVDNSSDGMMYTYDAVDNPFESRLEIQKVDAETGKIIKLEGASFKLRKKGGDFITMEKVSDEIDPEYDDDITAKEIEKVDTFTTDETGTVTLPQSLKAGTYEVCEVHAPNNYVINDEPVEFTIEADPDPELTDMQKLTPLTIVQVKDVPTKGSLQIFKKGQQLSGKEDNGKFIYKKEPLAGAEFTLYANEDIMSPDNNGDIVYKKGAEVATGTTDEDGLLEVNKIPLGKYYYLETKAPDGFVVDKTKHEVEFKYDNENTTVVKQKEEVDNDRQKTAIQILKRDSETEELLEGAVFGVYAGEDIKTYDGDVLYSKGDLIEKGTTDKEGSYEFGKDKDYPMVQLVIKEIEPPKGYATNKDELKVDLEKASDDVKVIKRTYTVYDDITETEISKSDITNGEEVIGATLKVWYKDDKGEEQIADEWVTTKDKHIIQGLEVGREYTLTEKIVADGYVTASDVKFKVEDTGKIQKVKMVDDVTKVSISKTDLTTGQPVKGATLQIIDKNGKVIEEWVTDDKEHYIEKLPIGEYILRERLAPTSDGYTKAEDVKFKVEDKAEIQKVEMKDDYTRISISKLSLVDGGVVLGAKLRLVNEKGDTVEEWITDGKEKIIEKLPAGKYILKELECPKEYTLAEDIEITVDEKNETKKIVMYDDIARVRIKLKKVDTDDQDKTLSGAEYSLYSEDGEYVTKLRTGADGVGVTPYVDANKTYYFKESKAPKSYSVSPKKYVVNASSKDSFDNNRKTIDAGVVSDKKLETPITPIEKITTFLSPKTGDGENTNILSIILFMLLMSSCTVGFILLTPKKKKVKSKNK